MGCRLKDDKYLLSLAESLGVENKIVSVGPKYGKDLIKAYASANVFVSAAEYEGFGISVLEAMAAGCPVIVNDIKAFRNFVTHGKNGYITDYSDEKAAAGFITDVLRSSLEKISARAKKYAKSYDWTSGTEQAVKVYEKVLNRA